MALTRPLPATFFIGPFVGPPNFFGPFFGPGGTAFRGLFIGVLNAALAGFFPGGANDFFAGVGPPEAFFGPPNGADLAFAGPRPG